MGCCTCFVLDLCQVSWVYMMIFICYEAKWWLAISLFANVGKKEKISLVCTSMLVFMFVQIGLCLEHVDVSSIQFFCGLEIYDTLFLCYCWSYKCSWGLTRIILVSPMIWVVLYVNVFFMIPMDVLGLCMPNRWWSESDIFFGDQRVHLKESRVDLSKICVVLH